MDLACGRIMRAGVMRALAWRAWYTVVYRGGRGVAGGDTCACYIRRYICDRMAGRFFSGYYMADFTGVNGGFSKKVSRIA